MLFCVCYLAVSLSTFGLYYFLGHELSAAQVFTAMALFNTLIFPLNAFPWVINGLVEGPFFPRVV